MKKIGIILSLVFLLFCFMQCGQNNSKQLVCKKNELKIKKWTEKDDVIYLTVTSDGVCVSEQINKLEKKGFKIGRTTEKMISLECLRVPPAGTTYKIAILTSRSISERDRVTEKIREKAKALNFSTPGPEIAYLLRLALSDKDIKNMNLDWIVVMHKPINECVFSQPVLFGVCNEEDEGGISFSSVDYANYDYNTSYGFAYIVED